MIRVLALCCCLLGCTLQNLTPQARFQESVFHLNDASRWNQLEAATARVSAKYQARFRERRASWGEGVNVAEVDLVFMELASDKESAVSEVAMSWTDASGVYIHHSSVLQKWANEKGNFRLVDEQIKKGDAKLFAEAKPETSGGQGP